MNDDKLQKLLEWWAFYFAIPMLVILTTGMMLYFVWFGITRFIAIF